MPDRPAVRLSHRLDTSSPRGVMTPMPVTTTRLPLLCAMLLRRLLLGCPCHVRVARRPLVRLPCAVPGVTEDVRLTLLTPITLAKGEDGSGNIIF